MHTEFLLENMKGRDRLEVLDIDGRLILELILKKCGKKMQSGCVWPRIGSGGGFL